MLIKDGFVPESVSHGKKFSRYYNEAVHKRQLKLLKTKEAENQIALISVSRVGSNNLKYMIEQIHGFHITDLCCYTIANQELARLGSLCTDYGHTQIIKSHFPWYDSNRSAGAHTVKKVVLMVREPLAVINSFCNLLCFLDHVSKIPDQEYISSRMYEQWVRIVFKEFNAFHRFWKSQNVPVYWVRFEDFKAKPLETLTELFEFMDGTPGKLDPYWASRINAVLHEQDTKSSYRSKNFKPQSILPLHRKEMVLKTLQEIGEFIKDCGYLPEYQKHLEGETAILKEIQPMMEEYSKIDELFYVKAQKKAMLECSKNEKLPGYLIPKPEFFQFRQIALAQGLLWNIYAWRSVYRHYISKAFLPMFLFVALSFICWQLLKSYSKTTLE